MLSPFNLSGRIALVTGGSAGLGSAAAHALSRAGAHLVLAARDPARLEASVQALRAAGGNATGVPLDVADDESCRRAVETVVARRGALDILVNAAGTIVRGGIAETSDTQFSEVLQVNAVGLWRMCRAASQVMRPGSAIVNLSSTAGLVGLSDRSAYAASKGAVTMITKALAVELAPRGIRVNAVAPGPFATDMSSASQMTDRWKKLLADRIPLGRSAAADEIGGPIVFLASNGASFVTGVVLAVDGGWTAS